MGGRREWKSWEGGGNRMEMGKKSYDGRGGGSKNIFYCWEFMVLTDLCKILVWGPAQVEILAIGGDSVVLDVLAVVLFH
jgi:hypothetical protein